MGNSCVYTALVNKLLKRLERKKTHTTGSWRSYIFLFYNTEVRQRVSLQRPPAVVKPVESFRDDVLQLRSDPSPGVKDQAPVMVVFSYREIKASLSVEYLRVLGSNTFPCPLSRERGVTSTGREAGNQNCTSLNAWHSCCANVAWPRQNGMPGNPLPFGAKWDLVPRLQSTASPEAPSLRQHRCGH